MELSETNIRTCQPGDVLKDATIKGLSLRAFPQSKTFYLYYRTKTGVQRRPKIGEWGPITLTQARKVAREMLMQVAQGGDPSGQRIEARAEPTMNDLWDEYWKRHASKLKGRRNYERHWLKQIKPQFGNLKLSEVTYSAVADLHEAMDATPCDANRMLAVLSGMFTFARRPLEWTDKNPADGVVRHKETKRKRYMNGEEAARLAEILHREAPLYPVSVAFIYLLILTGARRGEIASAKWSDLEGNRLVLKIHKTDRTGEDRHIYLPPAAMDILATLPRTDGTITGINRPDSFWDRIRKEAGCPDLRLHDLRHSFASAAISAGLSLAQIGELLGHRNAQTTHRYAHLVEEAAAAAATATADQIALRMKRPALV